MSVPRRSVTTLCTTAAIAVTAVLVAGAPAGAWSATPHAQPYQVGPLQKCLARKGFQYVRYDGAVSYPGVAGKSAWYTKDKHSITVIVMVNPNRATYLRHRLVADLALEWHLAQAKIKPGVGRRRNVVWENFKLTTQSMPPVATTSADLATIAACLPQK
jgi:hypothetical protein